MHSFTAQFLFNDCYFYRPTLSKRLVLPGTSCWSVRLSLPKQTRESSLIYRVLVLLDNAPKNLAVIDRRGATHLTYLHCPVSLEIERLYQVGHYYFGKF